MTIPFEDPVRREIWQTVRALNDAWTKGNPDDLANYFHRDMVAITASDRLRRDGGTACIAGWKGFAQATTIHRWAEIDPVIHVYGDAAVVAYYFDMAFEMNGQTIEMGGRDMFFFVKENGRWWAVADQFSGYPAEVPCGTGQ
ncbi:MAG TPA: nuclear transport factor 2 family protein [Rhodocyclaceae bacterium]|nr:nuclear transport factor 2 family protein [Rhodocyclaceae bacterium]